VGHHQRLRSPAHGGGQHSERGSLVIVDMEERPTLHGQQVWLRDRGDFIMPWIESGIWSRYAENGHTEFRRLT
jgi:hypothetical protein